MFRYWGQQVTDERNSNSHYEYYDEIQEIRIELDIRRLQTEVKFDRKIGDKKENCDRSQHAGDKRYAQRPYKH